MKTIIKIFKAAEVGNRRFFFKVEMEGHHPDSINVREVYRSLFLHYRPPFFKITVTFYQAQTTGFDMVTGEEL